MVERFVQLAETPGTPPQADRPAAHPVKPGRSATNPGRTGLSKPQRIVAFCPGAEYGPAKRWPAAHFAALARQLAEQGCAIWLFGSPKDHAVAEEISQLAPASVATCAAPRRSARPSICSPWPTWWCATTPA
jgi:heptosyltransferase-2